MYPKINELVTNKYQNLKETNDIDIKSIVKLINNQSLKSTRNPFTNLLLKKSLTTKKINKIKRNKQKENNEIKQHKKFLSLNEFINYYNNENKSLNIRNKIIKIKNYDKERANSYDEDKFFQNSKNKLFKNKKYIENRKIKSEINKKYKNKILNINTNDNNNYYNNIINIRRMNSSINSKINKNKLENKTIQTIQIFSSKKSIEIKKNNLLSKFRKNMIDKNKNIFDIKNRTKHKNLYFKNGKNYIIKENEDTINFNLQSLSQKRNLKNNTIYKIKIEDVSNFPEKQIINSYNDKKNYKNCSINVLIFTNDKIIYFYI